MDLEMFKTCKKFLQLLTKKNKKTDNWGQKMICLETFLFIFSTQGLLNVEGSKMQVKIGANLRLFSQILVKKQQVRSWKWSQHPLVKVL